MGIFWILCAVRSTGIVRNAHCGGSNLVSSTTPVIGKSHLLRGLFPDFVGFYYKSSIKPATTHLGERKLKTWIWIT